MSFSDFQPHYMTIKDQSGKELGKVRALNDSDMSLLWQKHEEAMEQVFETVTAGTASTDVDLGAAAMVAIRTAPDMVTDIICLAEDSKDWEAAARQVSLMPLGMRIDILAAILQITIYSEGGLEKLFGLMHLTRPQTGR